MDATRAGQKKAIRDPWRWRLSAWRDRWLSEPRFQRWASAFPLTRPIARHHARQLFDLCAGFVYSQILLACVRLRLLEKLRAGPLSLSELRRQMDLPPAAARALIDAAQALGLVQARGSDRVGLGAVGAGLLGNTAVLRMIEHHAMLYEDLRDPLKLLRQPAPHGELASYWGYARNQQPEQLPEARVKPYTALMADTQSLVAEDLLDAYPFARHHTLLDVGGGDGSFLAAVGARIASLHLMLFDLPAVTHQAHARLRMAGLQHRAEIFSGDFSLVALPHGSDLITLVRVLHDHEDAAALHLLRAIARALPPRGRVIVAEPMAEVAGGVAGTAAYFSFYLLAMGQGRVRTADETAALLRAAGFIRPHLHRTARPWQCSVMSAVRSSQSVN